MEELYSHFSHLKSGLSQYCVPDSCIHFFYEKTAYEDLHLGAPAHTQVFKP